MLMLTFCGVCVRHLGVRFLEFLELFKFNEYRILGTLNLSNYSFYCRVICLFVCTVVLLS